MEDPRRIAFNMGGTATAPCVCLACCGAGCSLCDPFARLTDRLENEEHTASNLRLHLQRKESFTTECAQEWDTDLQDLQIENSQLGDKVRELSKRNAALQESARGMTRQLAAASSVEQSLAAPRARRFEHRSPRSARGNILHGELSELKTKAAEFQQLSERLQRENKSLHLEALGLEHRCHEARYHGELEQDHGHVLQQRLGFLETALETANLRRSTAHLTPRHGETTLLGGGSVDVRQLLGRALDDGRGHAGDQLAPRTPREKAELASEVRMLRGQLSLAEGQVREDKPGKHSLTLLRTVRELKLENRQLQEELADGGMERKLCRGLERELQLALQQLGTIHNCEGVQ